MATTNHYPETCLPGRCRRGNAGCDGCGHLPTLEGFREWAREHRASLVDSRWSSTLYVAGGQVPPEFATTREFVLACRVEELEADLAEAREMLDELEQRNDQLESRIDDLELDPW